MTLTFYPIACCLAWNAPPGHQAAGANLSLRQLYADLCRQHGSRFGEFARRGTDGQIDRPHELQNHAKKNKIKKIKKSSCILVFLCHTIIKKKKNRFFLSFFLYLLLLLLYLLFCIFFYVFVVCVYSVFCWSVDFFFVFPFYALFLHSYV